MDEFDRLRWEFVATVTPGSLFLTALSVMRVMADTAEMVVGHGAIQVVAFKSYNQQVSAIATLVMEAATTLTFPEDPFALRFDLEAWCISLSEPVSSQPHDPLRIFKMAETTAIHFTAGQDFVLRRLGEAIFSEQTGVDIEGLQMQSVALILRSDCFLQLMETFAQYPDVTLTAHTDRIIATTQPTQGEEPPTLTFFTQAFQCAVRGVMPSTAGVLVLRWTGWNEIVTLTTSVGLTQEVQIYTLVHEGGTDWILFCFPADEINYLAFLMPPSSAVGR